MKVFVTGGTGFLGSHVVEGLLAAGHQVRALVRRTSDVTLLDALGVERVVGAVEDEDSLRRAVRGIDAVVHAAGLIKARSEADFFRVNHEGTQRLLDVVLTEATALRRFVLVSSIASGGPQDGSGPVSAYGRSKRRGEDAAVAVADRIPVTVVRPPVIYGPRDPETLPLFQGGRFGVLPVLGPADAEFSMIYGPDCAGAVVLALEKPHASGAIYYVDDGVAHTWPELGEALAACFGRRRLWTIHVPDLLLDIAARVATAVGSLRGEAVMLTADKVTEIRQRKWAFGHEKIAAELGWRPRISLPDGLARALRWYRENGWL